MPILTTLTEEETEIFLHLVRNKGRSLDSMQQDTNELIDQACNDDLKKKLAKKSEEENFSLKNRFQHEKKTMKYAKKDKMPLDQSKVKDLLRNQHVFRAKVNEEVDTYNAEIDNTQFQNGVLTYINEAAWGDLRDLLKDVGINRQTIRFSNVSDMIKTKDNTLMDSDNQWRNFANARFTMIDMTDYEYDFPSLNEGQDVQIQNAGMLEPLQPEMWPQTNALIEINEMENFPKSSTSRTHKEAQEARSAEEEEEEEEEEEDDDEDEDEEGEGEEEGEEGEGEDEEEEEEEEEDEEEGLPDENISYAQLSEDRSFAHNEKLRKKFNEVEVDGFMKLLNVKPVPQWEDDTSYHYKVGTHAYEDEGQHLDPYYHLLAEVERKHMERQQTADFRRGTEIKFVLDPKKKPVFGKS